MKKISLFVLLMVIIVISGCNLKEDNTVSIKVLIHNESGDNQCKYNQEYKSMTDCQCSGLWRYLYYSLIGEKCNSEPISYICREKINDSYIGKEVLIQFKKGVSLDNATRIVVKMNLKILEYRCNFEEDPFMAVEVPESQEKLVANELNQFEEVEFANINRIIHKA